VLAGRTCYSLVRVDGQQVGSNISYFPVTFIVGMWNKKKTATKNTAFRIGLFLILNLFRAEM